MGEGVILYRPRGHLGHWDTRRCPGVLVSQDTRQDRQGLVSQDTCQGLGTAVSSAYLPLSVPVVTHICPAVVGRNTLPKGAVLNR